MTKTLVTIAALSFAFAVAHAPSASAWHFASKRACFRHASAPDCGPSAVASCKSRKSCTLDAGKTILVCAGWTCAPKNKR
jgi:hypothetical protein